MISIEEEFSVDRPIAVVFDSIGNVGEIGYVVAGVEDVKVVSEEESIWRIQVKAGILAQTLTLHGTILSRCRPNYLEFRAIGRNVVVSGSITLSEQSPSITHCRVAVQSEVKGRLASIVNLVARTTQRQLIDQTVRNFQNKLAATTTPTAGA
jgi:carbon monoxide dehydrogenase subunit G